MEEVLKVARGSLLIASEDREYTKGENSYTIKSSEKVIVGFDGLLHSLRENVAFVIEPGIEVDGYSATGLAEYLTAFLDSALNFDENLRRTMLDRDDFKQTIENALMVLGMRREEADSEEITGNE